MVGTITLGMAFRDLMYAAGVGLFLAVGYYGFCFLFGYQKIVRFFADVLVFVVGAFMLRSLSVFRFYGTQVRWYEIVFCILMFSLCSMILEPMSKIWHRRAVSPVKWTLKKTVLPFAKVWSRHYKEFLEKRQKQVKKKQKTRLQNTRKVLYNSYQEEYESADMKKNKNIL